MREIESAVCLTVGHREGLYVEFVASSQTRFCEQLVHRHDQVPLGHTTHPVQDFLKIKRGKI